MKSYLKEALNVIDNAKKHKDNKIVKEILEAIERNKQNREIKTGLEMALGIVMLNCDELKEETEKTDINGMEVIC